MDNNDVNECCELLKQVTTIAEEEVLLFPKKEQESWMTPEIKDLLKERRNTKYDSVEYKNLDKLIKSKCICAHEEYLDKKCEETEAPYRFNPKQAHKRNKELKCKKFTNSSGIIKDKDGTILFNENDIKRRWLEYVKDLYDELNRSAPPLYFNGPTILKSEIQDALSSMRNGKALGSDKISAETLKALNHFGLELLQLLANAIYKKGVFPDELYKSTFITIPKKSGAVNCENFRTISIMSQVTKVIFRVVMLRIRYSSEAAIIGCFSFSLILLLLSETSLLFLRVSLTHFIRSSYEQAFCPPTSFPNAGLFLHSPAYAFSFSNRNTPGNLY